MKDPVCTATVHLGMPRIRSDQARLRWWVASAATFAALGWVCALAQDASKVTPPQPKSKLISGVVWDPHRFHKADGDTWPLTWAADNNMYGAAGDNQSSPMNFWKIVGDMGPGSW